MVSPKMQCRVRTVVLGASPKCLEMRGAMCWALKMLGTNVRHLGFSSPEIPPGKKTIIICMKLTQMAFPTSEKYIPFKNTIYFRSYFFLQNLTGSDWMGRITRSEVWYSRLNCNNSTL